MSLSFTLFLDLLRKHNPMGIMGLKRRFVGIQKGVHYAHNQLSQKREAMGISV